MSSEQSEQQAPSQSTWVGKVIFWLIFLFFVSFLAKTFLVTIPAAEEEARNNRAANYRELVLDVANGKERIIPMNVIVSFYTIVDQLERDKTITPDQANEARKAMVRVKKPQ